MAVSGISTRGAEGRDDPELAKNGGMKSYKKTSTGISGKNRLYVVEAGEFK
jgi:hypothetical protein